MAGHSQFKNIMYRKGAQDAKRAKQFARLAREVVVAVKASGPDADSNPRLRLALANCRAANMPKDNIERAIKKAEGGGDDTVYEAMRYEGYGSGGVAIIVETLTDNRNRTASDIRSAFNKFGGSLGETNSVSFMFDRVGQILYPAETTDADSMFEAALEAGAENVESNTDNHEITCPIEDFGAVRESLVERFGDPGESGLVWKPQTTTAVDQKAAETLMKLINALDDNDDVQSVSANFEMSDEVLEKLAG